MRRVVPAERILGLEGTRGLTTEQAAERRRRYGANDIVDAPRRPWADLARETAADPMLWFLVGTAVLYAALGDRMEAATLAAALLPLLAMDAFLHRRTQASTAGLSSRLASSARVVRDEEVATVAASEVVPGDVAAVEAGEPFPADGIVMDGAGLQADESSLTGEAYPVAKHPLGGRSAAAPEGLDSEHWAMAGTRLLTGHARMRVVFTGGETLYGEIVRSASEGRHARTPLQAAVARLVARLVVGAAAMCLLLAAVRLRQGHGLMDAALSAITLAVAALPEELPVALTFFLAVGVFRLARRQALVRRAVCVENIGRVTCICSDKTGTLTEGRLRVSGWHPAPGVSEERLAAVAAAASRRETGDPLDAAILDAAAARAQDSTSALRVATFPFTEDRRRETAVRRDGDGVLLAVTKGAPEVVLPLAGIEGDGLAAWTDRIAALAGRGQKVIACAWRRVPEQEWAGAEPSDGYALAGLVACEDGIRDGAADAVARCREAGIHTVLVTGDHPGTALAVARGVGLGGGAPRAILGGEVGRADVTAVDVVARASPAQKLELVRALQARGEVVAVTGDGVNDVPALQAADVGIAMGERGTRSAREVASIVLLDDNFRTIVAAVAEGRQLFRNLQRSFHYLLVVHFWLVVPATLVPLAGHPLLYLPIHIVWLELVIHPTAMLAFQELPAGGRLAPVERRREARLFAGREWAAILVAGVLLAAVITLAYPAAAAAGGVEHARGLALAAVTSGSAILAAALGGLRTRAARAVLGTTLAASVLFIQVPALAARVGVSPLHLADWALALAAVLLAVGLPWRLRRVARAPAAG